MVCGNLWPVAKKSKRPTFPPGAVPVKACHLQTQSYPAWCRASTGKNRDDI